MMPTLVEFKRTTPKHWLENKPHGGSNTTRLGKFEKRCEVLLRLSRVLASAHSQDFVTNIAAALEPVLEFDVLDIMIKPTPAGAANPYLGSRDFSCWPGGNQVTAGDGSPVAQAPAFPGHIKTQHSIPLISRGSELGFLMLGRFDETEFSKDEIEFLSQVSAQVAILVDNSIAHRHIAYLTERLAPQSLYLEDAVPSDSNFKEIIGRSSALRSLLQQVETVATTDSTVLIYGETGTGKELIARALHNLSARRKSPFIKLNCAAIPNGLLESELFGHERGAFTSAIAQRIGRFEMANRGTIFLDEIGEIPLELQPKLLRVLQEREFERLGSSRTLKTDARLITATNRDLSGYVQERKFRSDLFYRLNVFPLQVPPLRERREDIPLLVQHFVKSFSRLMNKNVESVSKQAMDALVSYSWPGNIRELENVIERAVIISRGPALQVPAGELKRPAAAGDNWKPQTLQEAERAHILATLKKTRWVLAGPNGAALRLGLTRQTLQFRMKKLGIVRPSR